MNLYKDLEKSHPKLPTVVQRKLCASIFNELIEQSNKLYFTNIMEIVFSYSDNRKMY